MEGCREDANKLVFYKKVICRRKGKILMLLRTRHREKNVLDKKHVFLDIYSKDFRG